MSSLEWWRLRRHMHRAAYRALSLTEMMRKAARVKNPITTTATDLRCVHQGGIDKGAKQKGVFVQSGRRVNLWTEKVNSTLVIIWLAQGTLNIKRQRTFKQTPQNNPCPYYSFLRTLVYLIVLAIVRNLHIQTSQMPPRVGTRRSQRKGPVIVVQEPAEENEVPLQSAAHADIRIQNSQDVVKTTLAIANPPGKS